jgi:hypothetical protein
VVCIAEPEECPSDTQILAAVKYIGNPSFSSLSKNLKSIFTGTVHPAATSVGKITHSNVTVSVALWPWCLAVLVNSLGPSITL